MPEVNKNNRRLFVEDEYDLYDVRKARPFWNDVCEVNGWQIIKDEEDFKEDYVCKINNELYFMELQVVGYWHNFDLSHISNVRISASKINLLREKIIELVGDLPRIELFARETAEGWDSWGNEIESS